MRLAVADKRKPKLAEFSFILPDFKLTGYEDAKLNSLGVIPEKIDTTGV